MRRKAGSGGLLVTVVVTTPAPVLNRHSNLGIKHDNSRARYAFGGMAKLKRTVLSAVQHHINSGYYPFWEYAVGMRRKPGFLCVVRWAVYRCLTQYIMLLVVTHYSLIFRIGPRLISVDAQDTT